MKTRFSRRSSFPLALLLLTASGMGCKPKAGQVTDNASTVAPARVQTAEVVEVEVPRTLHLTGSLRGFRETDLAANAAGRVVATQAERGQLIGEGQVLARLDVRSASLAAMEAKAQAQSVRTQETQARTECERYQRLKEKGAISDIEYTRIANSCQTLPLSAEAATARAQLAAQNVGDGVIRAPFPGVITERYVEIGQYVRQDSRVVTLVSVDKLRLELAVPEVDVSHVKEGAEVSFHVASYPARSFVGKVRFVSGAVRAQTRDLVAEAIVENPDGALKPGMFADVELEVGTRKLPAIPREAVFERDGKSRAFVVTGGRLEERLLSLGPSAAERTSVARGVALGEKIVTGDLKALANGQPVL